MLDIRFPLSTVSRSLQKGGSICIWISSVVKIIEKGCELCLCLNRSVEMDVDEMKI